MQQPQDSTEEKRFPPSARKLREARRRGDVVHSHDVSSTLAFGALLVALWLLAGTVFGLLRELWWRTTSPAVFARPEQQWGALLQHAGLVLAAVGIGAMAVAALASAAGSFAQVGSVAAWSRLVPRAEHLNPGRGWKRLASLDNLVELAKLLLKTLLMALLLAAVLRGQLPTAARLGHLPAGGQLVVAAQMVLLLLAWAVVVHAVLAPLDWLHRRHQFTKRQRMSLQELRRELQETEGHPLLLQRRREEQHEALFAGLADRIERATLVVHSGHVAVGLQYLSAAELPRIVLRGEGETALQIRRLAAAQRLYVEAGPALAEALYREGGLDVHAPAALAEPLQRLLRRALGGAEATFTD